MRYLTELAWAPTREAANRKLEWRQVDANDVLARTLHSARGVPLFGGHGASTRGGYAADGGLAGLDLL